MCSDDGRTDGKADTHVVSLPIRKFSGSVMISVKHFAQNIRRYSAPVILNGKDRPFSGFFHRKTKTGHPFRVKDRVLQKIHENLHDQQGIHGDTDEFFRDLHLHLLGRITFVKFDQGIINEFL